MTYQVKFSKDAAKSYKKLPTEIQQRIDLKLDYLRNTPRGHDTKKLIGKENTYRTRVDNYRLVYEIEDNALLVWVVDVGSRGGIYQ